MIIKEDNNKFRWVYEQSMLRSFFLLFEVWRCLLIAAIILAVILMVMNLISGNGFGSVVSSIGMAALTGGIIFVLSIPAYYIVTKANNNKYTVLFEMDDKGVDHIQIKTDAAKALEALTILAGVATRNRTTTASGILSAVGGSLYSDFSKVRKIRCLPDKNTIVLNGRFIRNQVYAEDEDFEFVSNFIIERCPNAKIS
jgi:hypothetical protein